MSKEQINKFENSNVRCYEYNLISKISEYQIKLEFNKNKKLKSVKLYFFQQDTSKINKLEQQWLNGYKLLVEKNLKFIDKGKIYSKKIKLFSNSNNKGVSKFIASIFVNNQEFYIGFYSISEGNELLEYLKNYKTPGLMNLVLNYLKELLINFSNLPN